MLAGLLAVLPRLDYYRSHGFPESGGAVPYDPCPVLNSLDIVLSNRINMQAFIPFSCA